MFKEYFEECDQNLVEFLSFNYKDNVTQEKVYYKTRYSKDQSPISFVNYDDCVILDYALYEDGSFKIEFYYKERSEQSFIEFCKDVRETYKLNGFASKMLTNFVEARKLNFDYKSMIFSLVFNCEKELSRIGIYFRSDRDYLNIKNKWVKDNIFPNHQQTCLIGLKINIIASNSFNFDLRYYFYALSSDVSVANFINKQLGKIGDEFNADKLRYYGFSFSDDSSINYSLYFRPKISGQSFVVKRNEDYVLRKNTGVFFVVIPSKDYYKDRDLTIVNELGQWILTHISMDFISIDSLTLSLLLELTDYDGSKNYYSKVYSDVLSFIENMVKKGILITERYS